MTASQASDIINWLSAIFGILFGIWAVLLFVLVAVLRSNR